jgi:hypothetical protein
VASYKFALAKSVLTLAQSGATSASLEDLAVPFSQELCEHLKQVDTQSTSSGSKWNAFVDIGERASGESGQGQMCCAGHQVVPGAQIPAFPDGPPSDPLHLHQLARPLSIEIK